MSAREKVRLTAPMPVPRLELPLKKTIKRDRRCVKSEKDCRFTKHVGQRIRFNDLR